MQALIKQFVELKAELLTVDPRISADKVEVAKIAFVNHSFEECIDFTGERTKTITILAVATLNYFHKEDEPDAFAVEAWKPYLVRFATVILTNTGWDFKSVVEADLFAILYPGLQA